MNERLARIERKTGETSITVDLNLDGQGGAEIDTGIGFLDHMLGSLAKHARFDLRIKAEGDLGVDEHHTVEDVGIALGQALAKAFGNCAGIRRMDHAIVPMDDALALVAVDVGGRGYAVVEADFEEPRLGQMGTDLIRHFIESLAHSAHINIHATIMSGWNDHHKAEALFKALARALDGATRIDERLRGKIPSTKGRISV